MSIATVIVAALFSIMEARCRQPEAPTPTPRNGPTPTVAAGKCSGSELRENSRGGLATRWCFNATSTGNNLLEVSSVNSTNTQCGTATMRLTSPSGKVYANGPATQPGVVAPWERGLWSFVGTVQDTCGGKASWTITWRD